MTRVLIWGGGGHGKVVSDVARAAGLEIIGFIDADIRKLNSIVEPGGARVVLTQQDFLRQIREAELPLGAQAVVLAVGDNVARCNCRKNLSARLLASVVHPSAVICNSAQIEAGAVIMPGAIVNAAAIVGPGTVINTGAIVEHDCVIGQDAHVAPGAVLAGNVTIGDRTLVGAGAVVAPQIRIGDDAIIGAGAVVLRNVGNAVTVAGNPAKQINP